MKIIAYYTKDTPYEEEILKLEKSLLKFNLDYHFEGIDNLGSWEANTHYKAIFIKNMLEKFKGEKLLYVDSDAVFNSKPHELENISCDIGVRHQDFKWREKECLSGTILLNPTMNTAKLVDKWIEINKQIGGQKWAISNHFEQINLGRAIKEIPDLKVYDLPPEYVFVFDHMRRIYPTVKPVIEHFQASRRFKKIINGSIRRT